MKKKSVMARGGMKTKMRGGMKTKMRGGMETKIAAAKIATKSGCHMINCN